MSDTTEEPGDVSVVVSLCVVAALGVSLVLLVPVGMFVGAARYLWSRRRA